MRRHHLSTAATFAAISVFFGADFADAQVAFTKLPTRIEEVLIEPNLGAVLRGEIDLPSSARFKQNTAPLAQTTPSNNLSPSDAGISYLGASSVYFPPARDHDSAADVQPDQPDKDSDSLRVAQLPSFARPADENGDAAESTALPASHPKLFNSDEPPIAEPSGRQDRTNPDANGHSLSNLKVRILGNSTMTQGEAEDVVVEVLNPTAVAVGPVDVNVRVPGEFTITRFDRDAWLDKERRIVAFRLDSLAAGETQRIRMKGISNSSGKAELIAMLSSGNQMFAQTDFQTQVFPQQIAKQYQLGESEPQSPIKK